MQTKRPPIFIRVIATLQIVGASTAFVAIAPVISFELGSLLLFVLMFVLAVCAFLSGIWLWNNEPRGYKYAVYVQAAQIPFITTSVLVYEFVFGLGLSVTLLQDLELRFLYGSKSYLYVFTLVGPTNIGFNLVAMIALVYLLRKKRSLQSATEIEHTNNTLQQAGER